MLRRWGGDFDEFSLHSFRDAACTPFSTKILDLHTWTCLIRNTWVHRMYTVSSLFPGFSGPYNTCEKRGSPALLEQHVATQPLPWATTPNNPDSFLCIETVQVSCLYAPLSTGILDLHTCICRTRTQRFAHGILGHRVAMSRAGSVASQVWSSVLCFVHLLTLLLGTYVPCPWYVRRTENLGFAHAVSSWRYQCVLFRAGLPRIGVVYGMVLF